MKRHFAIAAVIASLFSLPLQAASPALPDQAKADHLGVASCASSTCHGSVQASEKTRVLQNEYVTWSRHDPHANAMQTLRNDDSKRIVKNLGLNVPAYEAEICTGCHLDSPPAKSRGPKFTANDGIGCEACHGGAEKWLKSHTQKDRPHADNVADGMYPTADPSSRATLCLSCHMGNEDKFANHNIMGAGHPRLSFELQTFTEIQPAHYRIDDDYRARKNGHDPIQTWLIGSYENAIAWLELLGSDWLNPNSVFPELALFDCQSCHHPMADQRWKPRASKPNPPGTVRIADSHLSIVLALTSQLQPAQHPALVELLHKLHITSNSNIPALKTTAAETVTLLKAMQKQQTQKPLSKKQQKALLKTIIQAAQTGLFDDYNAAEQAAFGVQLLLRSLQSKQYESAVSTLMHTVVDEDHFDVAKFRIAMSRINKALQ